MKLLLLLLAVWLLCLTPSKGLLIDGTCAGRCNSGLDNAQSCQCNTQCHRFADCCDDYDVLCVQHGTIGVSNDNCTNFNEVTEAMWSNDVHRLTHAQFTLNLQAHVTSSETSDRSTAPLFTHVDETPFTRVATFAAFIALQNNYNPTQGQGDPPSSAEQTEINTFLDAVIQTDVMHIALTYLQCKNLVRDAADLKEQLRALWFDPYPRSPGSAEDSSGFEHVMVGEYKASVVNGLHSWIAFYLKEKAHEINYYGYVTTAQPDLVGTNYMWNGHHKELGAFFVGTSPEFDLALFSLCALTHSSLVRLNGHDVHIQIYDIDFVNGNQIASAYPAL